MKTDPAASTQAPLLKSASSIHEPVPSVNPELQDLIEYREMNFSVGNVFKACYRLGRKDGATTLYDLNKIKWYAEREIARLEAEKEKINPFEHVN